MTPRDRQVADLIVTGATNQEIADQLGLSRKTIDIYSRRVVKKLSAKNRTHAAVIWLRSQLAATGDS